LFVAIQTNVDDTHLEELRIIRNEKLIFCENP
jgi:hypothetical protein